MWIVAAAFCAFSQDAPPPPPPPPPPSDEETEPLPDPPEVDLDEAKNLGGLSKNQYAFLKPKRGRLPQNPYAQTDYTAYTVEFGEVKAAIQNFQLGVLPRTSIGTSAVLDLLGVYNINGKINALRLGPLDLAALGQYHTVPLGDFHGGFVGAGGMMSLRAANPWSVHFGASHGQFRAEGIPTEPPRLFRAYVPDKKLKDWQGMAQKAKEFGIDPTIKASATVINIATDLRFNRRDSIVVQFSAVTSGKFEAEIGGFDDAIIADLVSLALPMASDSITQQKQFKVSEAYVFTVSYQMSFKQMDLRVGGGTSADGISWLWQGNDASIRAFGKTRRDDTRRIRQWRRDRSKVGKKPGPLPPPAPPPE